MQNIADMLIARYTCMGASWIPSKLCPAHTGTLGMAVANVFGCCDAPPELSVEEMLYALPEGARMLQMVQMGALQTWVATNGPLYTIDAALAQQLTRTDSLSHIRGADLLRKHRAAWYVVPPEAAFVDKQSGARVAHVVVAHVHVQDGVSDLVLRSNGRDVPMEIVDPAHARLFVYAAYENGEVTCAHVPLIADAPINESLAAADRVVIDETYAGVNDPVEARSATRWVVQFVVNIMLLQQTYPRYVSAPVAAARSWNKAHGTRPTQAHIARPLGEPVVTTRDNAKGESTGTKQRPHWRCSHWRRQPHAAGFVSPETVTVGKFDDGREYHLVWIQTYLTGRNTDG